MQGAVNANIVRLTDVAFTVTGFKNPIQATYFSGFKITTAIYYDTEFYVIDEDETQLSVSEYATLSSPKLTVIVDEDNEEKAGVI